MIVPRQIAAPADVARHYDDLDALYRDIWGEHVHHGLWLRGDETPEQAVIQLTETVAARAQLQPGDRVCDVGCGYGATARLLARHYRVRVTGFTVSQRQFDYARSIAPDNTNPEYHLCDWLENDLSAASFDAVVAIESSEHMPDKARFFAEAHRVLRPGGRMVVCAWLHAENPRADSWAVRHLLEPICREGRLPGMGSESDYRRWFEQAGFRVEQFDDLSRRVARTWTICLARFLRGLLNKQAYRAVLFDRRNTNRVFGLTMMRLWLAYRGGAMRYGLFTARK